MAAYDPNKHCASALVGGGIGSDGDNGADGGAEEDGDTDNGNFEHQNGAGGAETEL